VYDSQNTSVVEPKNVLPWRMRGPGPGAHSTSYKIGTDSPSWG